MAVTSNTATVTPVVGSEIVVATIAGGPFDEVCAYVVGGTSGDGLSQLSYKLYAIVGALTVLITESTVAATPTAAILQWPLPQAAGTSSFVGAGGTSYVLTVSALPTTALPRANITATLAGVNGSDTAASTTASTTLSVPAFNETSGANIPGYAHFMDVSLNQTGLPQSTTITIYANCGGGTVEAIVKQTTVSGPDGITAILRKVELPVASVYRVSVRNNTATALNAPIGFATYSATNGGGGGAIALAGAVIGPSNANTIAEGVASCTYQPGGVAGNGVVTTWTDVQSILAWSQGKCVVYIDDSIVTPALVPAASGVTECFGRVVFCAARADAISPVTLKIENGATIKNPLRFTGTMEVDGATTSATPSIDFDFTTNQTLYVQDGALLANAATATQPVIVVPAGKQFDLLLSNEGGVITNIPGQAVIHTQGTCNVTALAALLFNAIVDGAGVLNFAYDSASLTSSGLTDVPTSTVGTYTKRALDELNPTTFGIDDQKVTSQTDWVSTPDANPVTFAKVFAVPNLASVDVIVTVIAKVVASNDTFCQDYRARYFRNGGGATLIGTVITGANPIGTGALATASATLVLSGNNVAVQVTGVVATNIRWAMTMQAQQVQ